MTTLTARKPIDLSLPMLPVPGSHHTCRLCGGGCRSYDVMLTEQEARRLSLDWWRPSLQGVPDDAPLVLLDPVTRQYALNKVEGRCVFLDSDNLCIVHKESGLRDKPLACQIFPFQAVQAPDGIHISLNVGCRRLVEMTDSDAPLDMDEAAYLLGGAQAVATLPESLALTSDSEITFDELGVYGATLQRYLTAPLPFTECLTESAAYLMTIDADCAITTSSRELFHALRRLCAGSPPVRSTLTHLYARSLPWLDALIESPDLISEPPDWVTDFMRRVAIQQLSGYQFALHRTARTGMVALLAALVCAVFSYPVYAKDSARTDHALNEALSDAIDLFLAPAGQFALTEPNQQAFLFALAELSKKVQ